MKRRLGLIALALATVALAVAAAMIRGASPDSASAASHREAPLISYTPAEDLTDVFMFRSYEAGNQDTVVMLMNVNPFSEPSGAPNYYNFDPNATYTFNVDNNTDGLADIRFEVNFTTEIRGVVRALGLPFAYAALPPITALDGAGSEGLGLRQKYTVRMITQPGRGRPGGLLSGTQDRFAVPSNVGPRTMPNYPNLASQGIYQLGGNVRVFAGQRQDPFYIDLGGVFDTLNLARNPPLLSPAEDAAEKNAFGVDALSGFNVSTIALEVPASLLTGDGQGSAATAQPALGMYASVSKFLAGVQGAGSGRGVGAFTQTNRMANPFVNELVIGTVDKDRWNSLTPDQDLQFAQYVLNPRLATAFELLGLPGTGCVPAVGVVNLLPGAQAAQCSKTNRIDLVNALLKYNPADAAPTGDFLRLNLKLPVTTPLASQNRLGVAAGDLGGFPNGRRPKDDVVDLAIRLVGGPAYLAARAGDGINVDDFQLPGTFPFLATPSDGINRVHLDRRDPVFAPPPFLGGP